MELSIIYCGDPIGTAQMQPDGIYWDISCRLSKHQDAPIRLYGVSGWKSEYFGIPDADGDLHLRIPKKHLPDGAECILASEQPNGDWKPWAGELDGIAVDDALVRWDERVLFALAPKDAVKFPEWIGTMKKEQISDRERLLLQLDQDGNLPEIEKYLGGTNNETMDRDTPADELPSDDPADDGFDGDGGFDGFGEYDDFGDLNDFGEYADFGNTEQRRQADRADF